MGCTTMAKLTEAIIHVCFWESKLKKTVVIYEMLAYIYVHCQAKK